VAREKLPTPPRERSGESISSISSPASMCFALCGEMSKECPPVRTRLIALMSWLFMLRSSEWKASGKSGVCCDIPPQDGLLNLEVQPAQRPTIIGPWPFGPGERSGKVSLSTASSSGEELGICGARRIWSGDMMIRG